MYKKNQQNSMRNKKIHQEKLENRYPTEDGSWGSLEDELGQRFPLLLVSFCKNQQAKSLLEMLKKTHKR
jgi:hypothetical protein